MLDENKQKCLQNYEEEINIIIRKIDNLELLIIVSIINLSRNTDEESKLDYEDDYRDYLVEENKYTTKDQISQKTEELKTGIHPYLDLNREIAKFLNCKYSLWSQLIIQVSKL